MRGLLINHGGIRGALSGRAIAVDHGWLQRGVWFEAKANQ